MSGVESRKGESFESLLRRFRRQIDRDGILKQVRERKHYEKPSEKKKKRGKRSR